MRTISKAWGCEQVWADTPLYTGKFLNFNKGACGSLHFHQNKDESWYVQSGEFTLTIVDPKTGNPELRHLERCDTVRIEPCVVHKLTCHSAGRIIEVSTRHDDADTYRVSPSAAAQ